MQIGSFSEDFYKYTRRRGIKWTKRTEQTMWGRTVWQSLIKNDIVFCSFVESTCVCQNLRCCGISDIDFSYLDATACLNLNDSDFATAIAKYIRHSLRRDKRVYIVGLPLKKIRNGSSQYNFKFYNRLLPVLEQFGFTKLTNEPYVNQNSKNLVQVLGIQNVPL